MHYACMVEGPLAEDSLSGTYYRPSKWMAAKLAIIKLLVSNGALAVQDNLYGWSPVYVAALYLLTDVVEFLLSMADISLEVKMAATEILGVSQATWMSDTVLKRPILLSHGPYPFSKIPVFQKHKQTLQNLQRVSPKSPLRNAAHKRKSF